MDHSQIQPVLPDLNQLGDAFEDPLALSAHGDHSSEAVSTSIPDLNVGSTSQEFNGNQDHFEHNMHWGYDTVNQNQSHDDEGIPDLNEGLNPFEEDQGLNYSAPLQQQRQGRRSGIKNLPKPVRNEIYMALLADSRGGKLQKHSTRVVAARFNTSIRTVQRIWERAKKCVQAGREVDVQSRIPTNCGKKKVMADLAPLAEVPLNERSTIRAVADKLGMKKSTLHKRFKEGELRRHSNCLKPLMKEENKMGRLRWCLSMLDENNLAAQPKFKYMDNVIHVDEKWFNMTKKSRNFYMLPDEEDPYRTVQNQNSIDKIMFLAAVAHPRFDDEGNCLFDGKIGVWAFVRKEPAQRASRNRARGTIVTKSINVDRDTMRSYFITKLLPSIVARWPRSDRRRTIWIQQDNATSHVPPNDTQFEAAVAQTRLDIRIMYQPSNSPDLNVLDLGFFASLQSLTHRRASTNIDELIANVEKEYEEYDLSTLRRVFVTLQSCMLEVMKVNGGNRYKVPHMNKARLEALNILPRALECPCELYEMVLQVVSNQVQA